LSTLSETRPRRDVSTSRDGLETETSRPRPHPWSLIRVGRDIRAAPTLYAAVRLVAQGKKQKAKNKFTEFKS